MSSWWDTVGGTVKQQRARVSRGTRAVPVEEVADAARTIDEDDNGLAIRFDAATTVSLPDGVPVGTVVELIAYHEGGITVQAGGSATVRNAGTVAQYGVVSCLVVAEDEWLVTGAVEAA